MASCPRRQVDEETLNSITERVIGAAIEVHRALGPGLLEALYENALCIELERRDLAFERQRLVPVEYKGVAAGEYRVDLIVEGIVVVELKSVAALDSVHQAQLLTYMRLAGCPIGLLINFNVARLVDGIKRMRI